MLADGDLIGVLVYEFSKPLEHLVGRLATDAELDLAVGGLRAADDLVALVQDLEQPIAVVDFRHASWSLPTARPRPSRPPA